MKRPLSALLAIGALAPIIPTALADTATMAGSWGTHPKYETITAPGGKTLAGKNLSYNVWPDQNGITSAYNAQGRWLDTIDLAEDNTLVTYSLSTHATVGRLREAPESLANVEVIMFGAPESPGNPNPGIGHHRKTGMPTTGDLDNVTMVVAQYDHVADKPQHPNLWTYLNTSTSVHTRGYDDLDLDDPDARYVDPDTGAETIYYRTEVLPMLRWRDWFTSDERMAELDDKYRPRVEAGYDRPGDVDEQLSISGRSDLETADHDADNDSGDESGIRSDSSGEDS